MPTKRVGANWFDAAKTFDEFVSGSVNAYYSVDGGADVLIEAVTMESYEIANPYGGDPLTAYQGSYNGSIPAGAEGVNVVLKIYDPNNLNDILEYDGFTIVTDEATSVVVSPSVTSVTVGLTRQFTATFYADDGLSTDNHDAVIWSVDGGGEINSSTGLFTAGEVVGGPHTVTATAGTLDDTAEVTITEDIIFKSSVHTGLMITV